MGLIAAALEDRGIRTVCLSTLEAIMEQVRPPRWLSAPFPLGFPLGRPGEPRLQRDILRHAFRLLGTSGPGPVRADFDMVAP